MAAGSGKQSGAPAPAFQPGAMGFMPGGLLSPDTGQPNDFLQNLMNQAKPVPTTIEELLAQQPQGQQELAAQVPAQDQMGPPGPVVGPPISEQQRQDVAPQGFGGKVEGFFGNLDQNLQSPSKVIGMGLLNQIDPRLAAGGLLAGGLFGKNKLF